MSKQINVMLLPSPPNSGSVGCITKSIGIAHELEKRGCKVCFVMDGKLADLISENGFQVYKYPVPKQKGIIQRIENIVDFIEWTGMADPDFIEQSVNAEIEAIRDFKPDVIFAEGRPSASISAPAMGIPTVMIAGWPGHPEFPSNINSSRNSIKHFNKQLQRFKLMEIDNIAELMYMRADVKLAPTIPELEPEIAIVKGIKYVGYILDLSYDESKVPKWDRKLYDYPQIFIYLSVSAIPPELYISVVNEAFRDLPYRVICACGFHFSLKSLPTNSGNIKFEWFVPAQSVIKDTSLVIFHGGQDTMLTSLLHGLPSITVPGQHFERDYNATQMVKNGVSKKLPVHAFRPSRLRADVNEVLNGPYLNASKKLSEKLSRYNGTEQCVEILIDTAEKYR